MIAKIKMDDGRTMADIEEPVEIVLDILIIDNDPRDIELIQGMLSKKNGLAFQGTYVGHLEKGLEVLKDQEIDVILLDLHLPDSVGFAPLERIGRRSPDTPVVVLTQTDDDSVTIRALQHGAQDFLVKDKIDDEILTRVIRYAIKRKQAEQALRQEKDRTQSYLDLAGVIFVALNRQGKVTLINRKGCDILGYSENEIIGKNWFDNFLPSRIGRKLKPVMNKMMEGGIQPREFIENPILTRNNEERLIAWHNTLLRDEQDVIIGYLASGEDISERKLAQAALAESEARFRALFETSPDGVIIVQKGILLYANPAFRQIFGITDMKQCIGHPIDRIIAPDDRERILAISAAREVGEMAPTTYEFTAIREDGIEIPVEVTAARFGFEFGGETATMAMIRDISERKEVQKRLLQNERLAVIGQLAAGVAHEINTPLSNISLMADNMLEESNDPVVQDFATKTIQQVTFAAHIVRDLLQFARPVEREHRLVNLHQIIELALEQIAVPDWVTIERDLVTTHPHIAGDRYQLQEVLTNILMNGIDAMREAGSGTLTVTTSLEDRSLRLSILDTGTGIPPEILERIYEPFYTTKPTGQGTGLGMALVQRFVQAHNGTVDITSQPGKGTTVMIKLPVDPWGDQMPEVEP